MKQNEKKVHVVHHFFHLSRCECIINRFVANASKQKMLDTAKLKKINKNH